MAGAEVTPWKDQVKPVGSRPPDAVELKVVFRLRLGLGFTGRFRLERESVGV